MMATTAQAPVETGKVTGRREIQFRSHDEVLADAERLAAGGYQQLGNWSLGQMCKHLAAAMNLALDGSKVTAPWPMRMVARLIFKPKVLRGPMRPGFKLPPKFAAVLVPDAKGDSDGVASLRTSVERFKAEPQRHPHAFFGPLSTAEWDTVLLNHAAMHLSFLLPR